MNTRKSSKDDEIMEIDDTYYSEEGQRESSSRMGWWYGYPGECGIGVGLRQIFIIVCSIIVLLLIIGIVLIILHYTGYF